MEEQIQCEKCGSYKTSSNERGLGLFWISFVATLIIPFILDSEMFFKIGVGFIFGGLGLMYRDGRWGYVKGHGIFLSILLTALLLIIGVYPFFVVGLITALFFTLYTIILKRNSEEVINYECQGCGFQWEKPKENAS